MKLMDNDEITNNKRDAVRKAFLQLPDLKGTVGEHIAKHTRRLRERIAEGETGAWSMSAETVANYLDDILRSWPNPETREEYMWVKFGESTVVGEKCVKMVNAVVPFCVMQCDMGTPDIGSLARAVDVMMVWTHG